MESSKRNRTEGDGEQNEGATKRLRVGSQGDGENHWLSLPTELIQIILCWDRHTEDFDEDQAFAAHTIICRLVCQQWRDLLPPPQGLCFWFGPGIALQGSLSLLQSAKELIPPHAWNGVACCKAAAKGGGLELLKWLKDQGEDGWNEKENFEFATWRGDQEMIKWLLENGCETNALHYINIGYSKRFLLQGYLSLKIFIYIESY